MSPSWQALRDAAEFTIYTPGSTSGVPLDVIGGLQRPAEGTDDETLVDEIDGYVAGLLGLVGIDADPLSSREHILLANLIRNAWDTGVDLDLATLVGQVQHRGRHTCNTRGNHRRAWRRDARSTLLNFDVGRANKRNVLRNDLRLLA